MAQKRAEPHAEDRGAIGALRSILHGAGYAHDRLREELGTEDESLTVYPDQLPALLRRLGTAPLSTFLRMFHLGMPVSVREARDALAPLTLEDTAALGITAHGKERAHGLVQLTPDPTGFLFASDREPPGDPPPDLVIGVGRASRTLATLTVPRPVGSALDLGTGCGYQAVLIARRAERVVATDVNPRALTFTEFNAALNGVSNIEVREGSFFDPVEGEDFDLIVCNPPFVISPESALVYRDSRLGRDRVSRTVVEGCAGHLRDGGIAHVLVNWIHDDGGDWSAPLREWVAGRGCDAWLMRVWSKDAQEYAALWNQRLTFEDAPRYAPTVERWRRYLEGEGIGAIGYGAVTLRRRAGITRVRADDVPETLGPEAGADIDATLGDEDRLAELDDAALLRERVSAAQGLMLEQRYAHQSGRGFELVDAGVSVPAGLRPEAEVDAAVVQLLAQADGVKSVREVIAAAASTLGAAGNEEASDELRRSAVGVVRSLIAGGFLRLERREAAGD
jgi:methylase of polypeptide subunit release factors